MKATIGLKDPLCELDFSYELKILKTTTKESIRHFFLKACDEALVSIIGFNVFMMEGVLPRTSKNRRCVDVLRRPNVENNGPFAKQTFGFLKNLLPKATMGMKARIVNSDPLKLLTSPHFQIHWMSLWLTLILGASLKIVPSSAMHIF